jgi:hypothetical protein
VHHTLQCHLPPWTLSKTNSRFYKDRISKPDSHHGNQGEGRPKPELICFTCVPVTALIIWNHWEYCHQHCTI